MGNTISFFILLSWPVVIFIAYFLVKMSLATFDQNSKESE